MEAVLKAFLRDPILETLKKHPGESLLMDSSEGASFSFQELFVDDGQYSYVFIFFTTVVFNVYRSTLYKVF